MRLRCPRHSRHSSHPPPEVVCCQAAVWPTRHVAPTSNSSVAHCSRCRLARWIGRRSQVFALRRCRAAV